MVYLYLYFVYFLLFCNYGWNNLLKIGMIIYDSKDMIYIEIKKVDIIGFICFIIGFIILGINMLRGYIFRRVMIDIFYFGGGIGVFGVIN